MFMLTTEMARAGWEEIPIGGVWEHSSITGIQIKNNAGVKSQITEVDVDDNGETGYMLVSQIKDERKVIQIADDDEGLIRLAENITVGFTDISKGKSEKLLNG